MADLFRFGEFELDVAAFTLCRAGTPVRLEKIPMEVLVLLVQHAGKLVSRDTLHAALWGPDVFVDRDAAINTAMGKIRKALGEHADRPRLVETVVGKGYRFVAPIVRDIADGPPPAPRYRLTRGTDAFPLQHGDNLIGRDPDVHVFLDHPSVSRRHARISVTPDRVVVEDLNSRNGTFVDGRTLTSPTDLHDGCVIGVGPITLTFVSRSDVASTRPMSGKVALSDHRR
jgi:DNA-binding winged helix-turn-helix (wHTH) protein